MIGQQYIEVYIKKTSWLFYYRKFLTIVSQGHLSVACSTPLSAIIVYIPAYRLCTRFIFSLKKYP